jgi:hypothetical protein
MNIFFRYVHLYSLLFDRGIATTSMYASRMQSRTPFGNLVRCREVATSVLNKRRDDCSGLELLSNVIKALLSYYFLSYFSFTVANALYTRKT